MRNFQSLYSLIAVINPSSTLGIRSIQSNHHFQTAQKIVCAFLLLLVTTFALAFLHEMLMLGVANLLRWSAEAGVVNPLVEFLASSSHHKSMIVAGLNVHPEGIAVSELLGGSWLQATWPALFAAPKVVAPGAWMSAVFNEESTAVFGVFVTRAIVEIILLAFGFLLLKLGLRGEFSFKHLQQRASPHVWLALLGMFILAQSIWAVWNIFNFVSLQETGIDTFVTQVLRISDTQSYNFTMKIFLPVALPLVITGVGIGILPLVGLIGWMIKKFFFRHSRNSWTAKASEKLGGPATINIYSLPIFIGLGCMLILAWLLPAGLLGRQSYAAPQTVSYIPEPTPATAIPVQPFPIASALSPATSMVMSAPIAKAPQATSALVIAQPLASLRRSEIRFSPAGPGFILVVNGVRRKIRAMNYNVDYTRESETEQIAHYRQDFDILKNAGFNTVTGYGVFNEVMLMVAEEKGIYVVMPFDLDPTKDYLAEEYRRQMTEEFLSFLKRYKDYSQVILINVGGDELATYMEMKHPSPRGSEERRQQIQRAVDFEFELAELGYKVTGLPTLLKEIGEYFLSYTETATLHARAQGKAPEKYIIIGTDMYGRPTEISNRLRNIVIPWVRGKLGFALMVSEFGSFGGPLNERPADYDKILSALRLLVTKYDIVGYGAYCFFDDEAHPENRLVNDYGLLNARRLPVDNALPQMAESLQSAIQTEKDLETKKYPLFDIYLDFRQIAAAVGGYPSSGIIKINFHEDISVEQYFVNGQKGGKAIAYKIAQTPRGNIEIEEVRQVTFNLLGDYVLEGAALEAYMANGGYPKLGAPISNAYPSVWNGNQGLRQDFAKGYALFVEGGSPPPTIPPPIVPTPRIPEPRKSGDSGGKD